MFSCPASATSLRFINLHQCSACMTCHIVSVSCVIFAEFCWMAHPIIPASFGVQIHRILYITSVNVIWIGNWWMLQVHSPDGSTFLCEVTLWPPSWKLWHQIENMTLSIDACVLEEHFSKFYPDSIWNGWRFFDDGRPNKKRSRIARCIWDQFLIQKCVKCNLLCDLYIRCCYLFPLSLIKMFINLASRY